MDISKEIAFFDQFESEHAEYDVLGDRAYRRLLRVFSQNVRPRTGESCMDLGCGSGAFTGRLEPFGLRLNGMDISPRLIERASASQPGDYQVGDIMSTGLPSESFDIVVYSGVLHHIPSPCERIQALREGWRLLRPGGRLFAYDPNAHSPSMFLYRDPRSPLYSAIGKTENEVLLSRGQLTSELRAAGFEQTRIVAVGGMTFRYVEGRLARKFLAIYNFYEWLLEATRLERWLGTFLVSLAQKT